MARVAAPGVLSEALLGAAEAGSGQRTTAVGPVVSADLFYDAEDRIGDWIAAGALAVEMEAAAIFTLAAKRGVEAGCVVLVSNFVAGEAGYMEPEALHGAELRLGELAIAALS
jgi:uridine phosphorylase